MKEHNHLYTNSLINESSPYLLQHAHNPVEWFPWGDEALQKAKDEDKMLIISIGYAACHWCHVMEHESFEDSLVARIMNDNFVCIKVDREERPDIDDVYMTACQLSSGRGCGWPLNSFALPDGRPVWAGTYFPKDQWINILNQFKKMKSEDPRKLEESADKITTGITNFESITVAHSEQKYSEAVLEDINSKFLKTIDFQYGGRQGAPKFPMPNNYQHLLHSFYMTGDNKLLEATTVTLDKMANGGIFDQLGGGFARYSTDQYWIAPHFEKMLYDNGQLVSLYSQAYQVTKNPLYKEVVEKTTSFVERELLSQEYGFYSSLDADSEGEEGKFYVWQASEIDSIIGNKQDAEIYKKYYSVEEKGNWEHTNILVVNENISAKDLGLDDNGLNELIEKSNQKLFNARSKRIRPGLDDKILTGWNGLMLRGYVDAYRAFGNDHYLKIAIKNGEFILQNSIKDDGRMNRNYKAGKSSINAFLDDYASVIDAFTALYEVTFDTKWIDNSLKLADYVHAHFYNKDSKMYYYTSDIDPALIARKMELSDNVISASNSMMARNLHKLGTLLYRKDFVDQSLQMLNNMLPQILESRQPNYYSNWCQLYATLIRPPYEIAVLGEDAIAKAHGLQSNYIPNTYFIGGKSEGNFDLLKDKLQEGRTMIYVCQNKVCKFPVEEIDKALALIEK